VKKGKNMQRNATEMVYIDKSFFISVDGSELDHFDDQYPFSPAIPNIVNPPPPNADEE
jgi:hypothetical protein